jgi:catechol 2,3-dioxygenase-like lactoylglutathione lyase family enzyme
MGRYDHVHIRVPDRAEAAPCYAEHLGFEPVEAYDFWATGFEGGSLQISADGGRTTLALFEATDTHPTTPPRLARIARLLTSGTLSFTTDGNNHVRRPVLRAA